MTPEERSNIENRILNYNKKGWTGSKGAILLQKAWELIEYYKESNKMAYEQSNFLEDGVIKAESENAELKEKLEEDQAVELVNIYGHIKEVKAENAELREEVRTIRSINESLTVEREIMTEEIERLTQDND